MNTPEEIDQIAGLLDDALSRHKHPGFNKDLLDHIDGIAEMLGSVDRYCFEKAQDLSVIAKAYYTDMDWSHRPKEAESIYLTMQQRLVSIRLRAGLLRTRALTGRGSEID